MTAPKTRLPSPEYWIGTSLAPHIPLISCQQLRLKCPPAVQSDDQLMNSQDDEEVPAAKGGAGMLRPLTGCRESSAMDADEAVNFATKLLHVS